TVATLRTAGIVLWRGLPRALTLDISAGSPWLLLPPPVRRAFDRLAQCGTPLADSPIGRPLLGVKCGCNDAFVVAVLDAHGDVARVRAADGREGEVERALLRPVLRGETVGQWRRAPSELSILWTHGPLGEPLPSLPPLAGRWLTRWKRRLLALADARGSRLWWSLFRTEG